MNCKGQIGQAITSFPVLIFVFVIMFIFFIISGFISAVGLGTESSTATQEVERINSRVLLEMFLGDYVLIDGKKEKIENALEKMVNERSNLAESIQQRFHEKYKCGKNNKLQVFKTRSEVEGLDPEWVERDSRFYINYPETFENLQELNKLYVNKPDTWYLRPKELNEESHSNKIVIKSSHNPGSLELYFAQVSIKGNVKC